MAMSMGSKPPFWYWIVVWPAVLWSASRCLTYFEQVVHNNEDFATLTPLQRSITLLTPHWVTIAFAVTVGAATMGSVGLLLRMKWARRFLYISLAAALVHNGWLFFASPILQMEGSQAQHMSIIVVIVSALLAAFGYIARRRGWVV